MNRASILAAFIAGLLTTSGLALAYGKLWHLPAVEARLIGQCDGRILAAMEEDQFPQGCDWIEPIKYQ